MDQQPTPQTPAMTGEQHLGVRPEDLPATSVERPSSAELAPGSGVMPQQQAPAPKLSAADVAAAIAAVPGPSGPAAGGVTPAPAVAEDVDVIEPEWVAKAEEVVTQHQGDPYGEEEAVEHLQQEYLQRRYGHTVADPNPDSGRPKP